MLKNKASNPHYIVFNISAFLWDFPDNMYLPGKQFKFLPEVGMLINETA